MGSQEAGRGPVPNVCRWGSHSPLISSFCPAAPQVDRPYVAQSGFTTQLRAGFCPGLFHSTGGPWPCPEPVLEEGWSHEQTESQPTFRKTMPVTPLGWVSFQ